MTLKNNTNTPVLSDTLSVFGALALASVFVFAVTAPSFAATQGTLGAQSSGTVNISVKKDARVKISNLDDMTVATWEEGNGDITMTDDVCIYSTRSMGGYKLAPLGSGSGNAFTLENNGNFLAYELFWNDGGAGGLGQPTAALSANSTSSNFNNGSTTSPNCSNGGTARMEVRINANTMSAAIDGTYSGVLTLIVSPS